MHHASLKNFAQSETGAVTVDWVVLTAAVVGLGIATAGVVQTGLTTSSGTLSSNIGASVARQSGGEGGFIDWLTQAALADPTSAALAIEGAASRTYSINFDDGPLDMTKPIVISAELAFDGRFHTPIVLTAPGGQRIRLAVNGSGQLEIKTPDNILRHVDNLLTDGETAKLSAYYDPTSGKLSVYKGTEKIFEEASVGTFTAPIQRYSVASDDISNVVVVQP